MLLHESSAFLVYIMNISIKADLTDICRSVTVNCHCKKKNEVFLVIWTSQKLPLSLLSSLQLL